MDVEMDENVKNNDYDVRKEPPRRRSVRKKEESVSPVPPEIWTEKDLEILLNSIKIHGLDNMEEICNSMPWKTESNIFKTITDNVVKGRRLAKKTNLSTDNWLKTFHDQGVDTKISKYKHCSLMASIFKLLSEDGVLENHPLPEDSQGVDFCAAYRYLYQSMLGHPQQPVNKETANFINKSVNDLGIECVNKNELLTQLKLVLEKQYDVIKCTKPRNNTNDVIVEKVVESAVQKPKKTYERKRKLVDVDIKPVFCNIECPESGVSIKVDLSNLKKDPVEHPHFKLMKDDQFNPLSLPFELLNKPIGSGGFKIRNSEPSTSAPKITKSIFSDKSWPALIIEPKD